MSIGLMNVPGFINMPVAYVRYNQVVVWKKPGGHHHAAILNKGDKVVIIAGWRYAERTWKDKAYIKIFTGTAVGYIRASALSTTEVKIETEAPISEDNEYCDDYTT